MTTANRGKIVLGLLSLGARLAWAQLYSGSVTGVITDPTDAVIPGAKVTLVDQAKGFVFNADSDGSGRYLFRNVLPSSYSMTVAVQGFQTLTRKGIEIAVNQSVTINFSMPLPTTTEAISISGEAPLLATEDASTGQVINRQFMNSLPVLGRSTMALSYLTPGVTGAINGQTQTDSAGNDFSSSGGRAWTADVLVDGVSATTYEVQSGLLAITTLPSPDAIEEFKIQTSNFSAEFGFTGANVVNMVMRSGTNTLHGSAYEYLRNSRLDSNNFFNNSAGVKIPSLGRHNFGATLGGPIRRDKTFFFFDYDGVLQKQMTTKNFGVPSAAERTGDFGELCGYQGGVFDPAGKCSKAAGQLWDPYSGTYSASAGGAVRSTYIPFNNMATYVSSGSPNLEGTGYQAARKPGSLIDPVALKLMQYTPLPNLNVGTPDYRYYNNWIGSGANLSTNHQGDVKIEHRLSNETLLGGKLSWRQFDKTNWNAFGNAGDTLASGPQVNHMYLAGANLNHTFSPTLLFNASLGLNRWYQDLPGLMADYPELDAVSSVGLPQYMKRSGENEFPQISYGSPYPGGTSVGTKGSTPIKRGQTTYQGLASLSWMKGSHDLKIGVETRTHQTNYYAPGSPGGAFSYSYKSTSQTPSSSSGGDSVASFLGGFADSGSYLVGSAVSTANWQYGGFVQDNWKIRRDLTLNIGFRYDLNVPRTERYNRENWLDPNVVSPLQVPGLGTLHGGEIFATPGDRRAYDTDYSNMQPRFGFAWRPVNKTVIRGGYGIFFAPSDTGASAGGGKAGFVQTTPLVATMNSDGATPWGRLNDPWPNMGPNMPAGNKLGLLNDVGYGASGPIRNMNATPYEQTWSLGIQRELPGRFLLDANYVGKKGTHLYFGGFTSFNYLGPQVENYSAAQIANLLTYVPNPFYGIIKDPNSSLSAATVRAYQLQLPFPQYTAFGNNPDTPPVANSIYHGLQVGIEKRMFAGFQFLATYTFSKALDDASVSGNSYNTGSTSLQDPNNRRLEYSVSLYDITHVFRFNHVYELPFGRGKKIGAGWNPVVNGILGGWRVSGIWEFDTGRPLMPGLTGGYSLPTYGSQRPDLVETPTRNTGSDWMSHYFANPAAFATPVRYAMGNAPRTLPWVRSPGTRNANLSVSKEFLLSKIREGMRLQYIVQAQNAFNTPQFAGPSMTVGSSSFGTVTSQANTPRGMEMALKFSF